jgi:exodeoxyribonuclease VII large subunit
MENVRLSVSDFIASANQTLEYTYSPIEIVGDIHSFKINQGKYVFFDLKDETGSISCFMMVFQLRVALEDGMKVVVTATPKVTQWGKFSLTVKHVTPLGEGSMKRNFELLVAKLDKEGLFDVVSKRCLPKIPSHIGVIASVDSAGYADFIKIINQRWGGISIDVRHVSVQGVEAPEAIISALKAFNEQAEPPELIAIIRGGGSVDDLAAFNDEPLTRAIAVSRVPIITGIGHEVDTTLVDMAADVRAATPSNVAQLIVPDKRDVQRSIRQQQQLVAQRIYEQLHVVEERILYQQKHTRHTILSLYQNYESKVNTISQQVAQLNPEKILRRGYALVRNMQGKIVYTANVGEILRVETALHIITTEVNNVKKR